MPSFSCKLTLKQLNFVSLTSEVLRTARTTLAASVQCLSHQQQLTSEYSVLNRLIYMKNGQLRREKSFQGLKQVCVCGFSSHARTIGEGSVNYYPHLCFLSFFLSFLSEDQQFMCNNSTRSTVAQWSKMTVDKHCLVSFVWVCFPDGFPYFI